MTTGILPSPAQQDSISPARKRGRTRLRTALESLKQQLTSVVGHKLSATIARALQQLQAVR
jgi:hypothetical protein